MQSGNTHITECPGYVRVDFGSCNHGELEEIYRAFADLCADKHVNRALLKAGDDYALRSALQAMAMSTSIPGDFKLALIPSTLRAEAIYREAQKHLRAAGFNAWVFRSDDEAVEWLQDRSTPLADGVLAVCWRTYSGALRAHAAACSMRSQSSSSSSGS